MFATNDTTSFQLLQLFTFSQSFDNLTKLHIYPLYITTYCVSIVRLAHTCSEPSLSRSTSLAECDLMLTAATSSSPRCDPDERPPKKRLTRCINPRFLGTDRASEIILNTCTHMTNF